MEYRHLGKSGLEVSAIGLGTNTFGADVDAAGAAAILHRALELGITFIDTAPAYGKGASEEMIGKALDGGQRRQAAIATKAGSRAYGACRKHLTESLEISLRKLRTDYVDLFQVHFPDFKTPSEETMSTLESIVRQGKARYIGCSNYPAWYMCEAIWTARSNGWAPFVSFQPEYSLLNRAVEKETAPFCEAYGLGIIPYYPLAAGLLTGKYRPGEPPPPGTRATTSRFNAKWFNDRNFALVGRLTEFAEKRDHTVAELAVAWLLARPAVSTVITGTTKPSQVEANAKAADWKLTPADMAEIDNLLTED